MLVRLEEGGQVFAQLGARVPLGRLGDDLGFKPVLVHDAVFVRVYHLVPADGVCVRLGGADDLLVRKGLLLAKLDGLVPLALALRLVAREGDCEGFQRFEFLGGEPPGREATARDAPHVAQGRVHIAVIHPFVEFFLHHPVIRVFAHGT